MTALMYHDVVAAGTEDSSGFPGRDAALYKVTPEVFASHLDAIALARPNRPLVPNPTTLPDPRDLPALPAPVITFDDGGASAMAAADALERRGFIGHFFITANYIGTRGFVTEDDIRGLARRAT